MEPALFSSLRSPSQRRTGTNSYAPLSSQTPTATSESAANSPPPTRTSRANWPFSPWTSRRTAPASTSLPWSTRAAARVPSVAAAPRALPPTRLSEPASVQSYPRSPWGSAHGHDPCCSPPSPPPLLPLPSPSRRLASSAAYYTVCLRPTAPGSFQTSNGWLSHRYGPQRPATPAPAPSARILGHVP